MRNALLAILVAVLGNAPAFGAESRCVQILYDRPAEGDGAEYGRHLGGLLYNLLGHFPKWQRRLVALGDYRPGGLEACEASIYLSAFDGDETPEAFVHDFAKTEKSVMWVGYNVDSLGEERLRKLWGVKYAGQGELEKREGREPGFYKYYEYRGETFEKRGVKEGGEFAVDYAVTLLEPLDRRARKHVVSWMRHSTYGARAPYVLRNGNHWYVADMPFSYVHEEDRYLIFADLLFDVLGEEPIHGDKHPALVRFEDVHPAVPMHQINALIKAAEEAEIPFVVSVIPVYRSAGVDPAVPGTPKTLRLAEAPKMVEALRRARDEAGGTLIMHGFTHQSDDFKNPDGISGIDYEFWDAVHARPMADDSAARVVSRLEEGLAALKEAGFTPSAWVTPHYAASPTGNTVLSQLFDWNIGRTMHTPFSATQAKQLPAALRMNREGSRREDRLEYFKDLQVEVSDIAPEGQFFPYEIFADAYGQRLMPEDVGYIRPHKEGPEEGKYVVDDMIRVLKRNRVLRDAWGSFYVHPFLADTEENGGLGEEPGDASELVRLFKAAKKLGYEFVSAKDWIERRK